MEKIVTWNFHIDDSDKSMYDMILGRYILTALVLDLIFFNNFTEGGDRPFERCTAPMVDLGTYKFKDLDTGKIILE